MPVRVYVLLFPGARHASTISLKIGLRERIAVLRLAALILDGGLFPQPGISSQRRAAEDILIQRKLAEFIVGRSKFCDSAFGARRAG